MSSRGGGRGGGRGDRGGGGLDRGRGRGRGGGDHSRGEFSGGGDRGRGGGGGFRGGRGGAQEPISVHKDGSFPRPDSAVTKAEDEFMKQSQSISTAVATLSLGSTELPVRPGYGTNGTKIVVFANYFPVTAKPKLVLYRYHVDVVAIGQAPKPSKPKIKRIVTLLLEDPTFRGVVTDYRSMIVSVNELEGMPKSFDVPFKSEGEDNPPENPAVYRVKVDMTGTMQISTLIDYLESTNPRTVAFTQKLDIIQVLNVVFGHAPQSNPLVATLGQNTHVSLDHNPSNLRLLGGSLEALRGYFKSVRPAATRLLLNANVSHAICFESIQLDRLMTNSGLRDYKRLGGFLKYIKVMRLHLPARVNKSGQIIASYKTICDLATTNDGQGDEHPPQVSANAAGPKNVKFFLTAPATAAAQPKPTGKGKSKKAAPAAGGSGRYISVWDYFAQNYPSIKMNQDVPVVNVGSRNHPSYLPAEACKVAPGQASRKKLSPAQTRAMIEFACRRPKANADSIVRDGKQVLSLVSPGNSTLTRFGLSVGDALITVPARVLAPPQIKYANNNADPRGGSWNMINVKFHRGGNIRSWTYLLIQSTGKNSFQSASAAKDTIRKFVDFMRSCGINIGPPIAAPPPPDFQLNDINSEPSDADLKGIGAMITRMGTAKHKPEFLFVILPYNNARLYGKIKTVADTIAGISTVCAVGSKFSKDARQEQYFANVALKFNLKAGGINHIVDPIKLGLISEGETMVVGIDVTHPSPGSKSGTPSVAGIVASVDKLLGQWPADLRIQEPRKEMVTELRESFGTRLILWQKRNGNLPQKILIYRDGVSEGQYQQVLELELPELRKACEDLYPATETTKGFPKISIIIVGKRHHTRFYPTQGYEADRSHNCKNGTVVDRGVTEMRTWDFFLQAHACLQGTSRPAHYVVILDEIFRNKKSTNPQHKHAADTLEDITHNMCHLFGRATKAVSICPPAYYADLLCERARCYLSRMFDPSSDTPAQSVSGTSADDTARDSDVLIQESLRHTMFYI